MISNLPAIILKMRNICEILLILGDVIPVVIPVVVNAETDSKSEFKKPLCSTNHNTMAVAKDTAINKTIISKASLKVFSSLTFSAFRFFVLLYLIIVPQ